ncbi:MAG: hypothetical protein MR384_13435 [Lachnospiraceae bacterium]|nr:hypothetical protein [Lachnospiraceae bacterium]
MNLKKMKQIISIIFVLLIFSIKTVSLANDTLVYVDDKDIDTKYHSQTCHNISKEYHTISVEEAFEKGYKACSDCLPPISDKEYNLRQEEAKKIINSVSSNSNNEAINNNDKRIVYVTSTGSVYHLSGCSKLDSTPHSLTLTEATNKGYAPCKKCNPYNLAKGFYNDYFNPYILLGIIPLIFIILILFFMNFSLKRIPNTHIK